MLSLIPVTRREAGRQAGNVLGGTRLDVVAHGKIMRVPDLATVCADLVAQALTAEESTAEIIAQVEAIRAVMHSIGIPDDDIAAAGINLEPEEYRYAASQPPIITGYRASNTMTIHFRDIAKAGDILQGMVREGAFQINGPMLSIEHPQIAEDEARTAAMKDAQSRAKLYADAAGLKVRRILAISESSDIRPRIFYTDPAASFTDMRITTGEHEVSVTVSVTFELD